ncbi:MAG: calcium/sodium antiporter [Nannocystaceae bacterium]|nr:calcium/sodium antiporter [Nannocystaceae bacterium]
MLYPAATVVAGLLLLAFAADRFVTAAARLSRHWGMSPILVGALIVGMGTSAPELLVSGLAAAKNEVDLAIGNAVGSNVANVTMVLGGTALLTPLAGNLAVLKREGALMFGAVALLAVMLWDLRVTRVEGIVLLTGMVAAAWLIVRWARLDRSSSSPASDKPAAEPVSARREVIAGLLALALTLLGADLLVRGGTTLAESIGLGSAFVGMTLIAVGTSLPELATSIAGIRQGEHDLVLGNVVGSNLFNALAVAGIGASLAPGPIDPAFRLGAVAMVLCSTLAGFLALTGRELVRWEGILLLFGFAAYVWLSYDPTLVNLAISAVSGP